MYFVTNYDLRVNLYATFERNLEVRNFGRKQTVVIISVPIRKKKLNRKNGPEEDTPPLVTGHS